MPHSRVLAGHPWVFANECVGAAARRPRYGAVVECRDRTGAASATGMYSSKSQIVWRRSQPGPASPSTRPTCAPRFGDGPGAAGRGWADFKRLVLVASPTTCPGVVVGPVRRHARRPAPDPRDGAAQSAPDQATCWPSLAAAGGDHLSSQRREHPEARGPAQRGAHALGLGLR